MKKPIVLCILDGVGIGKETKNNAVYQANTPTLDYLKETYSSSCLKCGGVAVGLPEGQMGNSEVGHLNIGAGRIVYQSLSMINQAIEDGSFEQNDAFLKAIKNANEKNVSLHLMGLLSDGGVHSHINHLKVLLKMAKDHNVKNVFVHAFMDGRDTLRNSGLSYMKDILAYMDELKIGKIATISGRYYAMDRDQRFERNELTYSCMVTPGTCEFEDPICYIEESYQNEVYDEFIKPASSKDYDGTIKDQDSVIFFNYRPDRAIQMASLLACNHYSVQMEPKPKNILFVSMMEYNKEVEGLVAFEHEKLNNVLGPYLSNKGYQQLRIAETEKYAHVTFFFDGQVKYDGVDAPELANCKRILINSPKVATYDLEPKMSAEAITDSLIAELDKDYLDVVILNYANGDMVGHTGKIDAAIEAIECVDACVARLYQKIKELDGVLIVTADHGNSEEMLSEEGHVLTAHTINDVMFLITKKDVEVMDGKLSDIAPSILDLLNVEKPIEMSGSSLIKKGE